MMRGFGIRIYSCYKIELFKVSVIESGTLGSNIGRVGISPSHKYLEEQEEWVRAI